MAAWGWSATAPPDCKHWGAPEKARHHQIGTIRMGTDRTTAVVDANCRAFDVPNLHVISTAVLPTSGQANPTLTAVQLGLRLAEHLTNQGRQSASSCMWNSLKGPRSTR